MINTHNRKTLFILSGLTSFFTLVVAGYSLINQSVYHPRTPEALMPGAVSQDLVSVLAAFGLLACMYLIRREWNSAWLIWVGLLAYLFYAYALYSFERIYNPLFLFYITILGLSVYSLIGFFKCANLVAISPKPERNPPPRKSLALLLLLFVVLFIILWLSILIPAMKDRISLVGNSIFVLDLVFFLLLLMIEAVLLFKKDLFGDVLVIFVLIKIGTLGISVLIGTLISPWFGQVIDLASVSIYAFLVLGPLAFVISFLSSLKIEVIDRYKV